MPQKKPQRSVRWSWTTGERGSNRVRVFTHPKSGRLYLEWYEPAARGDRPRARTEALGHDNRDLAKRAAEAKATALRHGIAAPATRRPVLLLGALFDTFEQARKDVGRWRPIHHRARQRFVAWFGEQRAVHTLDEHEIERYAYARRHGRIVLAGRPLPAVRTRVIEEELVTLRTVLRWALRRRTEDGSPLLAAMPIGHWSIPREENPRRVQLPADEYTAMRDAAMAIDLRFWLALVLCHATGHRINSVRQLRWPDVDLEASALTWQGESQKNGMTHQTPLTPEAVNALRTFLEVERMKGAPCDGFLFPSPNPAAPLARTMFYKWWPQVRAAAKLPPRPGAGFHCFRRAFASDLSTAPLAMVKALGGWKHPQVVIDAYQEPTMAQQRAVLANRRGFAEGAG